MKLLNIGVLLLSDEAWQDLGILSTVRSVTCRSSRNPFQVYQRTVHDMKSEIGCAVQCKTIIVPLVLLKVLDTDDYIKLILVHSSKF